MSKSEDWLSDQMTSLDQIAKCDSQTNFIIFSYFKFHLFIYFYLFCVCASVSLCVSVSVSLTVSLSVSASLCLSLSLSLSLSVCVGGVYLCVCTHHTHTTVLKWRSDNVLRRFSISTMSPGNQNQVVRLGGKHPYSLIYLTSEVKHMPM